MKLSLVFVAAVALFASGCSSLHAPPSGGAYTEHAGPVGNMPEIVPVWIDKGFSEAHRVGIHSAFAQWNVALNGYESFKVVSDSFDMEPAVIQDIVASGQGLLVLRRKTTDDIMAALPDGVLGWVSMPPGAEAHVLNIVEDAVGNRNISSIAMHEIGHTLRLPHLFVKHTLLYHSYSYGAPCIDLFTVQTLATIRGWEWHNMNWCAYPL